MHRGQITSSSITTHSKITIKAFMLPFPAGPCILLEMHFPFKSEINMHSIFNQMENTLSTTTLYNQQLISPIFLVEYTLMGTLLSNQTPSGAVILEYGQHQVSISLNPTPSKIINRLASISIMHQPSSNRTQFMRMVTISSAMNTP